MRCASHVDRCRRPHTVKGTEIGPRDRPTWPLKSLLDAGLNLLRVMPQSKLPGIRHFQLLPHLKLDGVSDGHGLTQVIRVSR